MKKIIPNTLTCCNLVSGCVATWFAFQGSARMALLFIIVGAFFDFFDGFSARLLKVSSPIGKELDSLADVITFGFAPSAILFFEFSVLEWPDFGLPFLNDYLFPALAFVMAAFSALRLAKFNLDTRQTTSFLGMPTPANALFWGSLVASQPNLVNYGCWASVGLLALMFVCSYLLVCELPMFALKFKHWGWKGNELRYSFVLLAGVLLAVLGPLKGFWVIIVLYLMVSVADTLRNRNKNMPL